MTTDIVEKVLPAIMGIIVFAALLPIAMHFISDAAAAMGPYGDILIIVPIGLAIGLVYSVTDLFKKEKA